MMRSTPASNAMVNHQPNPNHDLVIPSRRRAADQEIPKPPVVNRREKYRSSSPVFFFLL